MAKKPENGFASPEKIPEICEELQRLQRQRAIVLKSRNMQSNRLEALVADTLGYYSALSEVERRKKYTEAAKVIESVVNGTGDSQLRDIIKVTMIGINAFEEMKKDLEKRMTNYARMLPVSKWVEQPAQRGFGQLFLAIVIGETGDLNLYGNPAKLWKRMGVAPYSFENKTLMGATWRSGKEGKLPASEWETFGYSPRRRSISYLIGEGLCKQNQTGPYRTLYNQAKAKITQEHPSYPPLRCHRHGMLVSTKRLLLNLWEEWRK